MNRLDEIPSYNFSFSDYRGEDALHEYYEVKTVSKKVFSWLVDHNHQASIQQYPL